jgi:hypothetical protein
VLAGETIRSVAVDNSLGTATPGNRFWLLTDSGSMVQVTLEPRLVSIKELSLLRRNLVALFAISIGINIPLERTACAFSCRFLRSNYEFGHTVAVGVAISKTVALCAACYSSSIGSIGIKDPCSVVFRPIGVSAQQYQAFSCRRCQHTCLS